MIDSEEEGDDADDDERFVVERSCVRACKGLKMRRKMAEKGEAEEERGGLSEEREEEESSSSSEMTQSTRMRTFSTWGTREWNLRETTQHRPRDLTSEILLKTRRRIESGRWSKWSISRVCGGGSGWIREGGSERGITAIGFWISRFGGKLLGLQRRNRIRISGLVFREDNA